MGPSSFFTKEQKAQIIDAIKSAELNTSAEIRVHIENRCKKEVLDRAVEVFSMLKMENTALRNGVLIYVAIDDKKSAIIGDVDINKFVKRDFWTSCHAAMSQNFSKGNFTEGICEAIKRLEEELHEQFPHQIDDINELPDDISFGK